MPTNLTLLLLTKNSSEQLKKNFTWLKNTPNINEIVVVDDLSSDDPKEVLEKIVSPNTKINCTRRELRTFSYQRNIALKKATNDWILWLDPDEKAGESMVNFLSSFPAEKPFSAYSFKRKEVILGHTLRNADASTMPRVRLFHKKHGVFIGNVHEIWQSTGKIKPTNIEFMHEGNATISIFLEKINRYSTLKAQELYKQHKKVGIASIILYPMGKFAKMYWIQGAYKDGMPGMIYSLMLSFHSFLVRSKLWHLHNSSSQFPV